VFLSYQIAAYLTDKDGFDVIGVVIDALRKAGYNKVGQ